MIQIGPLARTCKFKTPLRSAFFKTGEAFLFQHVSTTCLRRKSALNDMALNLRRRFKTPTNLFKR